MAFNGIKITEYKNGRDAATGTPALGTTFNNEFDRLYENENHLNNTKFDKAGGSVSGNLEVQGNLTVQGNTVQVNVTEVNVEDKVVTLNNGEAGPGVSGDGLSGIEVDRGISQDKARLVFDESDGDFKAGLGSVLLPLLRLLAGNKVALDELIEKTLDHGITIDGVFLKDGAIIQSNRITVTTATQQMENNKEYFVNYTGGRCILTLPVTSDVGDTIKIRDIGIYGWKIAQNAGQNILLRNGKSSVPGTTGDIHSRIGGAAVELICTVANMTWKMVNLQDEWMMKGYAMGGFTTANVAVIEDLNFSFETSDVILATLNTAKGNGAGVSGNLKGYMLGGAPVSTVIEDLNFASENSDVIAATLNTAKADGTGVSSNLKGYILGGYSSVYIAAIEYLNYSDETSNTISATLDTGKRYGAGLSTILKGYILGGSTGSVVNVIEDLDFPNETSNIISATLDTAKRMGIGLSGSLKGYILGGFTTALVAVIEDFNFFDETSNTISATLNTAKTTGAGVSGDAKGYIMGGNTGSAVAVIEGFNFLNETINVNIATLNTAKYNVTGVQGYIG